jgi:hypothetical protein
MASKGSHANEGMESKARSVGQGMNQLAGATEMGVATRKMSNREQRAAGFQQVGVNKQAGRMVGNKGKSKARRAAPKRRK